MHAFDILGGPVRRRILELLADGEQPVGAISAAIQNEFGISQPAVSQHLRMLRENGFATVRADGTRRLYAADPTPLREIDVWLERYRRFWHERPDATGVGTEPKRGQRRRATDESESPARRATDAIMRSAGGSGRPVQSTRAPFGRQSRCVAAFGRQW